jgi:hypothetical protein
VTEERFFHKKEPVCATVCGSVQPSVADITNRILPIELLRLNYNALDGGALLDTLRCLQSHDACLAVVAEQICDVAKLIHPMGVHSSSAQNHRLAVIVTIALTLACVFKEGDHVASITH